MQKEEHGEIPHLKTHFLSVYEIMKKTIPFIKDLNQDKSPNILSKNVGVFTMNQKEEQKLSKFMSLILRHQPEKFGLNLAIDGTCKIHELITAINAQENWSNITTENIFQVVENCPKQRYDISGDAIKANYGHSSLKIQYQEEIPPRTLYHGTNTKVIDRILKDGLKPMGREYVHMSVGKEFAALAGKRRGDLVLLAINAKEASENGIKFFYAENEVWLADYMPSNYLTREINSKHLIQTTEKD